MRYYEFIVEYRGALDSLAKTYGQRILDKLKIVPQRINSGYKGDAEIGDDYETIAVRTLDQLNSEHRLDQNLPITSNHGTTEYENLTPEIYNEHKGAIVNRIIGTLAEYDPTEKKGYTQYILKWYLNDNVHAFPNVEDGKSTLKESLYYFQKMKGRLPENYRDIAQYTSAKNFMASVQHFRDEYGKKEKLDPGDTEVIYDSKYATIYWAKDEEGSCYLGQGTQWCTAATRSTNYFDQYNKDGPLLIINMKDKIRTYDGWQIDDDGGEHEDPEGERIVNKIQAHMEVDPDGNGKLLWTWEDIADPTDHYVDFSSLYDDNPNFKAMWDSPEFQKAMDDVSEKWWDYNGLALQNSPNGD